MKVSKMLNERITALLITFLLLSESTDSAKRSGQAVPSNPLSSDSGSHVCPSDSVWENTGAETVQGQNMGTLYCPLLQAHYRSCWKGWNAHRMSWRAAETYRSDILRFFRVILPLFLTVWAYPIRQANREIKFLMTLCCSMHLDVPS